MRSRSSFAAFRGHRYGCTSRLHRRGALRRLELDTAAVADWRGGHVDAIRGAVHLAALLELLGLSLRRIEERGHGHISHGRHVAKAQLAHIDGRHSARSTRIRGIRTIMRFEAHLRHGRRSLRRNRFGSGAVHRDGDGVREGFRLPARRRFIRAICLRRFDLHDAFAHTLQAHLHVGRRRRRFLGGTFRVVTEGSIKGIGIA